MNFKKTSLRIGAIMLLGILPIILLQINNEMRLRPLRNFERHFAKSLPLISQKKIEHATAIVGFTNNHLYLQSRRPDTVIQLDYSMQSIRNIRIKSPLHPKVLSRFRLVVDSPHVSLFAGNYPAIFVGDTQDGILHLAYLAKQVFGRHYQLTPSSFVFRGFTDDSGHKQLFYKVVNGSVQQPPEQYAGLLSDDAGMSTDGLFQYDPFNHHLFYIQFYQNNIFQLDTNLRLLKISHTIDHAYQNQVVFSNTVTHKKHSINNSTPKLVVNRNSFLYRNLLFIQSGIRSKEESFWTFNDHAIIDVYDTATASYRYSFYIPYLERQKLIDFAVHGPFFIALYESKIAIFRFAAPQ